MSTKEIAVISEGVSHPLSTLSPEARAQVANLHFVDEEILRLTNLIAVCNAARNAYQANLTRLLPAAPAPAEEKPAAKKRNGASKLN